ncbi:MAG: hypothetical protein WCQ47_08585 [bacterium]
MVTRSSSDKHRFIGLMLSGGRSPNTAICVIDYFKGRGRLFLVESFVGKKEQKLSDLDDLLVERLKNIVDEDVENTKIITNAPLSLPPCFKCKQELCPGKDKCKDTETLEIMKIYEELKGKKKNLRKFSPYTQRLYDVWLRKALPEIIPQHESAGSNLAQITARMLYLKKVLPYFQFRESYPVADILRLLTPLGLNNTFLKSYRDLAEGKRARTTFMRRLENKADVFIYDSDLDAITGNVYLFESMVLAFTGVLYFLGKTEGPSDQFIVPNIDVNLL